MVDDAEMAGVEGEKAAGEESDDGSEDLEAESSGSEDELEEEEVEGEADDMDMDGVEKPNGTNGVETAHHVDAVMAH